MRRLFFCFTFICALLPAMAVEIAGLPDQPGDRYDLTWEMGAVKTTAMIIRLGGAHGYQVRIDSKQASWQQLGAKTPVTLASAALGGQTGGRNVYTLKRRPQTMALLLNHRLLFAAPASMNADTAISFLQTPAGTAVNDARYQAVEPHTFGDDFMRPEAPRGTADNPWVEDPTWGVAFYKKSDPAGSLRDAKSNAKLANPWQLSLYQVVQASTNGFWFLYTGVGPSWVVANSTQVAPNWDRYAVQAAVFPEYDSAVGVIAAYQDDANYLLFRWKAREYVHVKPTPRAEIIAVIDGKERVLASDPRGFDPGQWYTLRLNVSWQRVEALVDGKMLLTAKNSGAIEGRVGLYADGPEHPRRPSLDDATAKMYAGVDEETGKAYNDAADAMRNTSTIYFDDVRISDWVGVDDLLTSPYAKEKTGVWNEANGIFRAQTAARVLTGATDWDQYVATTSLQVPAKGSAGIYVHLDETQTGYAWTLSAQGQQLQPIVKGVWQAAIDRSTQPLPAGTWADLRVEAEGPYVACYYNGQRVLEAYDTTRTAGRCGLYASAAGMQFRSLSIRPLETRYARVKVHDGFDEDTWLITWASSEADWYPAFTPRTYVTPSGVAHSRVGPAAPLPTNAAGLYWQKGGFYHDVRVTIPVSENTVQGQTLHLSTKYDPAACYRVTLTQQGGKGAATLKRAETVVGTYPFTMSASSQIVFERKGSILLLTARTLDPEDKSEFPDVLEQQVLCAYRDPLPLPAEMIGFTVTTPSLPAAQVLVESDRLQDAFETSPVNWMSQSGVWAVMARYSCQPKWNWYGGFGAGTPTVWNKMRLDGDQNIEVYLGVKMQYENMTENEGKRFRDLNVTICADGAHLNSGYSVIRAGRFGTMAQTLLLRKGVVVATSSKTEDLLPTGTTGHRQWFATRIEKRGAEIRVYLDNHLAMTYTDPEPLTGGYTAFWTLNNGIMIGRANLSAEKMSLGSPQAFMPVAVQEIFPTRLAPIVKEHGVPVEVATFEAEIGTWKQRDGLCGVPVRERVTDAADGANTYLKVVNSYPAGDFSTTITDKQFDLLDKPVWRCDYNFDKGAQVNLYLRSQGVWYEILLTGLEAQERVSTVARLSMTADGMWHTLRANLGDLLATAIEQKTGKRPDSLMIQEAVIADWSAPVILRQYGFNANPGGTTIRFDNVGFIAATAKP